MKVKVGDKVYDGEKTPVMVILSNREKDQIANMGDAKKYCVYPSEEEWTANDYEKIKAWMKATATPTPTPIGECLFIWTGEYDCNDQLGSITAGPEYYDCADPSTETLDEWVFVEKVGDTCRYNYITSSEVPCNEQGDCTDYPESDPSLPAGCIAVFKDCDESGGTVYYYGTCDTLSLTSVSALTVEKVYEIQGTLDDGQSTPFGELCATFAGWQSDWSTGNEWTAATVRDYATARKAWKEQQRTKAEPVEKKPVKRISNHDRCNGCKQYRACRGTCRATKPAEHVSKLQKCPLGHWLTISIVIPARAEQEELQLTIDSAKAAGADEIIIVDDGENAPYQGEDIRIVQDPPGQGPAACRNAGLAAATCDVIAFSDSHVRFSENSFQDWAHWTKKHGCMSVAAVQSLNGPRRWTAYGARILPVKEGLEYESKPVQKIQDVTTGLYGSVYAATRDTWKAIGGWPHTISWGYNEQALSLACLFAAVPVRPYADMIALHMFKKRFGYSVQTSSTHANRVLTHWYFFDDFETKWAPYFRQKFPKGYRIASKYMATEEFKAIKDKIRSCRKRTDEEVYAIIQGDTQPVLKVTRKTDSPVHKSIVTIQAFNGLGDALLLTPTLARIKEAYPHLKVIVNTNHPQVFQDNPHVDVIGSDRTGIRLGYPDPKSGKTPTKHHILTDCGIISKHAKLDIPEPELRPLLYFDYGKTARDVIGVQVLNKGQYGGKKIWPYAKELSRIDGFEAIPKCKDFRALARKVARYKAVVCSEGAIAHIAKAVGTQAVVVYGGFSDPYWNGYHSHINLVQKPTCGYCYDLSKCDQSCMKAISIEDVLAALQR